ncbi:MAG: SCO family protein, partial [Oceanobacter sp.]
FVSVDPDRDVSANMRTYLKYFHPDFLGLTGNPESLQQLATELNGYYSRAAYGKTGYLMDHSANMMLVDEQWNYRGFIEPPFTTERLLPLLQALPQIR